MKTLLWTLLLVVVSFPALAHRQVAVIPLSSKAASLDKIVTVSASGGDFTTISAALNSITDASSANPYLIVVGPGTFTVTQPITMEPGVSITGSGVKATIVSGAVSQANPASSAIFLAASNSVISSMTIRNSGGSTYSLGILADSASDSIIEDVQVEAFGGTFQNYGILDDESGLTIRNSTVTITDNSSHNLSNIGIYFEDSTGQASSLHVTAEGTGNSTLNSGVIVSSNLGSSDVTLDNLKVTATGGYDTVGVGNSGSNATFSLMDSEILVSGGNNNNSGIESRSVSGTAYISNSLVQSSDYAVNVADNTTAVAVNSTLMGDTSVVSLGGAGASATCLNSNNGTAELAAPGCTP